MLRRPESSARLDRLATVLEHVPVEGEVVAAEVIAGLLGDAFGKRGLGAEPALDVLAPPLDDVRQKTPAVGRDRAGRRLLEGSVEQAK